MELVEGKGILGNDRYYDMKTSKGGPSPRQVSIIDRSIIKYHEEQVGKLGCLSAGKIRSNIETTLVYAKDDKNDDKNEMPECPYIALLNKRLMIGNTAILEVTLSRTPCWEMDAITQGLQQSMKGQMQGVMAKVIRSGIIKIGDPIVIT
jgi:MOSC domain-containing protein YiiM